MQPPQASSRARPGQDRNRNHAERHPPPYLDKNPIQDGPGNELEVDLDEAHRQLGQLLAVITLSKIPKDKQVRRNGEDDGQRVNKGHALPVRLVMDVCRPNAAYPLDNVAHALTHERDVGREEEPDGDDDRRVVHQHENGREVVANRNGDGDGHRLGVGKRAALLLGIEGIRVRRHAGLVLITAAILARLRRQHQRLGPVQKRRHNHQLPDHGAAQQVEHQPPQCGLRNQRAGPVAAPGRLDGAHRGQRADVGQNDAHDGPGPQRVERAVEEADEEAGRRAQQRDVAEARDARVGVALRPEQGDVDVGAGEERGKGGDGEHDGDDEEVFEGRRLDGRREEPPRRGGEAAQGHLELYLTGLGILDAAVKTVLLLKSTHDPLAARVEKKRARRDTQE